MMPSAESRSENIAVRITLVVAGVAALLAVMMIAFALPAVKSSPQDIPLGAVGTPQQAQQLQQAAHGFDIEMFIDDADARDAILHRDVYGAVLFDGRDITTVTATAASPAIAAMIPALGQHLAAASGGQADNVELRSFPADDPQGVGLAVGALPLALGGWIGAMIIMMLIPTAAGRLIATCGVAVVSGLTLVAAVQFGLGTFDGNYWFTSLAATLGIAATCCAVLGLREFFGAPGLGVAAILLIFLGNPLSGLSSAPELLPQPWGKLGQVLPPGATGSLLRDVVFFHGHGAGPAVAALTGWLIGGLGLYLAGMRRNRRTEQQDVDEVHVGHRPITPPHDRVLDPAADAEATAPMRRASPPPADPWARPVTTTALPAQRPAPAGPPGTVTPAATPPDAGARGPRPARAPTTGVRQR